MNMVEEVPGLWDFETYRGTLAAAVLRRFERCGEGSTIVPLKNREEISPCNFAQLPALWLLQCRLAWYGFRSVKVRHLRQLNERTLLVELLETCGPNLFTVEIDSKSGAIRRPAGRALVCLLASLRQATTEPGPLVIEPMASW